MAYLIGDYKHIDFYSFMLFSFQDYWKLHQQMSTIVSYIYILAFLQTGQATGQRLTGHASFCPVSPWLSSHQLLLQPFNLHNTTPTTNWEHWWLHSATTLSSSFLSFSPPQPPPQLLPYPNRPSPPTPATSQSTPAPVPPFSTPFTKHKTLLHPLLKPHY